ncbi:hypothetical protein RN01_11605 [Cupriavidus sp. SHE]|jgi:hypothetical protein|nr:hypothetical protein RN01_11605 [Cupriavidus sp. SHE]KWW36741.1 hypothetical protein AU374_02801 [Cupriavidus metallidurans]
MPAGIGRLFREGALIKLWLASILLNRFCVPARVTCVQPLAGSAGTDMLKESTRQGIDKRAAAVGIRQ